MFPAFGADAVSFIDPNDIDDANNGALLDLTPDEQAYARQGGEVGLFLEDDSLDAPVRRVLIPHLDMTLVGYTDVKAHSAEIRPVLYRVPQVNDYVAIGDETVRKVVAVVTATPPASTMTDWYLEVPSFVSNPAHDRGHDRRVEGLPDAAHVAAVEALAFTLSGFSGSETVTVTVTGSSPLNVSLPTHFRFNDHHGNAVNTNFTGAAAPTNITAVDGSVTIGAALLKYLVHGESSLEHNLSYVTTVPYTYTFTFSATSPTVATPVTHTLKLHVVNRSYIVTLDRPFAMDRPYRRFTEGGVYLIDLNEDEMDAANWDEDYGLYAKAIWVRTGQFPINLHPYRGSLRYRGEHLVAPSMIATRGAPPTPAAGRQRGDGIHRLTARGSGRLGDDDALVVRLIRDNNPPLRLLERLIDSLLTPSKTWTTTT